MRGIAALLFGLCMTTSSLLAVESPPMLLHNADGSKAVEVVITGGDIAAQTLIGRRKDGSSFTAKWSAFAEKDRAQIREFFVENIAEFVPGAEKYRWRKDPTARLRALGEEHELEQAVEHALEWLSKQQHADGSFGGEFPVAMTALALLAYSGHGETMGSGEHGATVTAAIRYLVEKGEKANGVMATRADRFLPYEHGLATWALADAIMTHRVLGESNDLLRRAERLVPLAAGVIVRGQTKGGGWLYSYGQNGVGDLSVSVWNLYALDASLDVLGEVPAIGKALRKAGEYLKLAAVADGTYKYRIRLDMGKQSLVGHGLVGHRITPTKPPFEAQAIRQILEQTLAADDALDLYPIFTQCDALFAIGGAPWLRFNRDFVPTVAGSQSADGSWRTQGKHHRTLKADTPIYMTCLGALILETYYR